MIDMVGARYRRRRRCDMEPQDKHRLLELERTLRMQHPEWSEDKRRWLAMQGLGILPDMRR